jgi:hypothetical protein
MTIMYQIYTPLSRLVISSSTAIVTTLQKLLIIITFNITSSKQEEIENSEAHFCS